MPEAAAGREGGRVGNLSTGGEQDGSFQPKSSKPEA